MPRPLRILTLSTLFPNAAQPNFGIFVERQTAGIARREGFEIVVFNPIGLPPWPLTLAAPYRRLARLPTREEWRGLSVHRPPFRLIPKLGGARNPAAIARTLLPLVRDLHALRPFDLIDAEFFYPDGPAAMRIADALGIPFTVKARGADIHYWGARADCREQMLEAAGKAAGLLAVSEALKGDMVAIGMEEAKIRVHHTGVDRDRFAPKDRAAAKAALGIGGPLLLSVGALIARKGHDLALETLARLPDATLLIAGDGPERGALEAQAKRLGVADRLRLAGSVPHDNLPRLYDAADAMLLLSESEGLANAWVEALASGTPIVISDAGGAREAVVTPEAGRIVARDPEAAAEALRAILTDPPPRDAVRAASERFSWERNGDELAEFFRMAAG